MSSILFTAAARQIHDWTIVQLPDDVSKQLPSRGMVMVDGTMNGSSFKIALEPDGRWGHWFKLDESMQAATGVKAGQDVRMAIEPTKEWTRPEVPEDLRMALAKADKAHDLWRVITPAAQWEWIRWIRATNVAETRQRRVDVAISKLTAGKRRPCCYNRNACSEPYVSKNWMLIEPTSATA